MKQRLTTRFALVCFLAFGVSFSRAGSGSADRINTLVKDLPHVVAEERGGRVVLVGWTRGEHDRQVLDRILAKEAEVLDLTTQDIAETDRMVEVDVTIVVVSENVSKSVGFDFLKMINLQYNFFATSHRRDGTGYQAAGGYAPVIGGVERDWQYGQLFGARVDYNVNIANASDQLVQIVARPHLTALNGQKAEFLAGGEIVFKVSGIDSGDIKPYPFGIQLNVTPTILRSPAADGSNDTQVILDVEAQRLSVLGRLLVTESAAGSDDVNFDKTRVASKTLLKMNETLILSGLYQREYRKRLSGVPVLRDIPVVKYFFSNETEVDDVLSTIVFITPREPGKINADMQTAIENFIKRRSRYVEVMTDGRPEVVEQFKQEYPDWFKPQANRYATHFFLVNNSEIYRSLRGEDLRGEQLRRDLMSVKSAREASTKR
jgi:hypothetical protein